MLNSIEKIVRHSGVAQLVTDANRTVVFLNSAFSDLCGYPPDEILGKNPGALLQRDQRISDDEVEEIREKLRNFLPFEFSVTNFRQNGSRYQVGILVIPFLSGPDSVRYFASIERELNAPDEAVSDCPKCREAAAAIYSRLALGRTRSDSGSPPGDRDEVVHVTGRNSPPRPHRPRLRPYPLLPGDCPAG